MTRRHARMSPVVVLLLGGLVVALVGLPPAAADEHRPRLDGDPGALRLLVAAAQAQGRVTYEGVQYVTAWDRNGSLSQVVDIRHVPNSGTVVTVGETAAGRGATMFAPAADGNGSVALLARNYSLTLRGVEPVAGRDCAIVEARRPGGSLAARFWLDRATALILRREIYDHTGEAVKASSFVQITVGQPVRIDTHLPPALPRASTERLPLAAADTLRADGWTIPAMIEPSLSLYSVGTTADKMGTIVHLTYSDGLSTVSLFEQRGHLDAGALAGFRKVDVGGTPVYVDDAIPYRASWSADGLVYTVVADAPQEMVHAAIAELPREPEDNGVLSRVERGMSRIASWFNPFG